MLGAILNPNKFLPFASAVATFVMFVVSKYRAATSLLTNIEGAV